MCEPIAPVNPVYPDLVHVLHLCHDLVRIVRHVLLARPVPRLHIPRHRSAQVARQTPSIFIATWRALSAVLHQQAIYQNPLIRHDQGIRSANRTMQQIDRRSLADLVIKLENLVINL